MVVLCGLAAELHGFSASSRAYWISRRPTKRGIGVDGNGLGIGVVGTGDGRAEGTGVKREPSRSSELPAQALVASSAAVAALMSFQAGSLARRGVASTTTAFACGVVAAVGCAALEARTKRTRRVKISGALASQALLGGLMPHLAFFAIPRAGLAVANCLMFTMPLWTGVFAACTGAPWSSRDTITALVSLAGVVLVVDPLTGASIFSPWGSLAALAFGTCGGALNVLVQSAGALQGTSPNVLTSTQMLACALIAAPFLGSGGPVIRTHLRTEALALTGVGCLMATQNTLRVRGLQLSALPSVATLLYLEILFCCLLDVLALGTRPRPTQILGAALIVGGALLNAAAATSEGEG